MYLRLEYSVDVLSISATFRQREKHEPCSFHRSGLYNTLIKITAGIRTVILGNHASQPVDLRRISPGSIFAHTHTNPTAQHPHFERTYNTVFYTDRVRKTCIYKAKYAIKKSANAIFSDITFNGHF